MTRLLPVTLLPILTLGGCYQLDGFFFNPTATDAYALGGDLIPASCQELADFSGRDGTLSGAWAHQPPASLTGVVADTCETGEVNPDADVVIYFHGNADNIDHYWSRVEFYWQSGYEVFLFDYRGYGRSYGEPDHDGVIADGKSAVEYVVDHSGRSVDELVYIGLSLGGFVSIHTAGELPPRILVTEDMFASAQTLLNQGTLLDIPEAWFFINPFDNLAAARELPATLPYMVVHGADDTYIQPSNAELVFDAAASDTKELFLVPGMDHDETIELASEVYRPQLECWIAQDCASSASE